MTRAQIVVSTLQSESRTHDQQLSSQLQEEKTFLLKADNEVVPRDLNSQTETTNPWPRSGCRWSSRRRRFEKYLMEKYQLEKDLAMTKEQLPQATRRVDMAESKSESLQDQLQKMMSQLHDEKDLLNNTKKAFDLGMSGKFHAEQHLKNETVHRQHIQIDSANERIQWLQSGHDKLKHELDMSRQETIVKTFTSSEQSERLNIQLTQLKADLKERAEGQRKLDEKMDVIKKLRSELCDAQQGSREHEIVINGLRAEKSVIEGRVGYIEVEKGAYVSTKIPL